MIKRVEKIVLPFAARNWMWRSLSAAVLIALLAPSGCSVVVTPWGNASTQPSSLPDSAQEMRDVAYVPNGHERQKLDLYLPAGTKKPAPLVIWVHGGGWWGGDKSGPPALRLVKRGYAVASVNYRYSTQAIFPAQMHDLKAAVRFLRGNARRYNIDPDRFAAWGFSAGGQLVALLGTSGGVQELEGELGDQRGQSSRVQCVIDWAGAGEFRDARLPLNVNRVMLLGGTAAEKPELARLASPIAHVSSDDPPMLIMHGEKDGVVDPEHSRRLHAALEAAGVETELVMIKGAGHGGGKFYTPEMTKVVDDFLDAHLKR